MLALILMMKAHDVIECNEFLELNEYIPKLVPNSRIRLCIITMVYFFWRIVKHE